MSSSGGSLAVIAVRNERHRHDARVEQLAPLLKLQRRSWTGEGRADIAQGDRALQRWREAAAGDPPDLIAFAGEHQRAFAHRLASVDLEAAPPRRRTILELRKDAHRSGEPALGAAARVDREVEASHHRGRPVVEIVTVERQA